MQRRVDEFDVAHQQPAAVLARNVNPRKDGGNINATAVADGRGDSSIRIDSKEELIVRGHDGVCCGAQRLARTLRKHQHRRGGSAADAVAKDAADEDKGELALAEDVAQERLDDDVADAGPQNVDPLRNKRRGLLVLRNVRRDEDGRRVVVATAGGNGLRRGLRGQRRPGKRRAHKGLGPARRDDGVHGDCARLAAADDDGGHGRHAPLRKLVHVALLRRPLHHLWRVEQQRLLCAAAEKNARKKTTKNLC